MPARFTLEKRTNRYGECPIRFSWIFETFRIQSTLGYSIGPEQWDNEERAVRSGRSNHLGISSDVINHHIRRIERIISEVELKVRTEGGSLSDFRMKDIIKKAKSNPLLTSEDIISEMDFENEFNDSRVRYYRSINGNKYRYVCNAFDHYHNSHEFFVIQELFGKMRKLVVPSYKFGDRTTPAHDPDVAFWEISENEALRRKR